MSGNVEELKTNSSVDDVSEFTNFTMDRNNTSFFRDNVLQNASNLGLNETLNGTLDGMMQRSFQMKYGFIYILVFGSLGLYVNTNWLYCVYKVKSIHTRDNIFHINLTIANMVAMMRMMTISTLVSCKQHQLSILLGKVEVDVTILTLLCIIGMTRLKRLSNPYMRIPKRMLWCISFLPWALSGCITILVMFIPKSPLRIQWPAVGINSLIMLSIYGKMIYVLCKKNTSINPVSNISQGEVSFNSNYEVFITPPLSEVTTCNRAKKYIVENKRNRANATSDASLKLKNEYKRIMVNSLILLVTFLLIFCSFSILVWSRPLYKKFVSYTEIPEEVNWIHATLLLIAYNIYPFISFLKVEKLNKKLRDCYCGHTCWVLGLNDTTTTVEMSQIHI
ncbi:unnamed protein product [Owenia fusiformis]|uniref:G-protein coupled receptors family 1 profile domain-containing protein n=1 Tax=Owenia fusiformis TaxID=6347 RepID=A0A8S4N4T4_OWEFU|nr:unnamed protein product [Owenia fusiformis]